MLGTRVFKASTRAVSSTTRLGLLERLVQNPELTRDEAQDELRWMKQSLAGTSGDKLAALVERRARGEPLQYILGESRGSHLFHLADILGSTDFGPLTMQCRAPTLIPRPETAEIFTRLASLLETHDAKTTSRPLCVLDLCTGSAPIPILLKYLMRNRIRVSGYDYSDSAIELARENIALHDLDIDVHQADVTSHDFTSTLISSMAGRVDLVVSNPPYVTAGEYRTLPPSVRDWEDPAALLGSPSPDSSGLEFYHRITNLLPELLTDEKDLEDAGWAGIPRVAVEIGSEQGEQVQQIFQEGALTRTEVWQDQYHRDRMVLGWL